MDSIVWLYVKNDDFCYGWGAAVVTLWIDAIRAYLKGNIF